ncbi:MAG: YcjF family protein [Acidobacteria bacterium]|nr:YcjF family protein [Acidobacteriota bacterium]
MAKKRKTPSDPLNNETAFRRTSSGRAVRTIALGLSALVLFIFVIFVVNQTAQVVDLAKNVSPFFSQIVFWALIGVYLLLLLIPLFTFLRLPKPLVAPDKDTGPEYERFLNRSARRLRGNRYVDFKVEATAPDIKRALDCLGKKADETIKDTAGTIFLTTAISQSGKLDSFTVLIGLSRLIWKVAVIFYQRPTLRDLMKLYGNVAATVFVAGELEDIDISRQVDPIIGSVLGGSLTGAIPGVSMVATIVTSSLMTGAVNAYLALRVGQITKKYCASLHRPNRKSIRSSASLEAAKMLSVIVLNMAGKVSKAILNAALSKPGRASRDFVKTTWNKITNKGESEPDGAPEA